MPASAQMLSWTRYTQGANDEIAQRTAYDAAGNMYVVGYYSGATTFGPWAGSPSLTSAGSNDVFVIKYAPDGTAIWAVSAGGTGDDRGQDIAVDASGNVYILSNYLSSSASFGASTLTNSSNGVYNDISLAKLNSNGQWQWAVRMGGASADNGYGLTVDNAGNSFVTGIFMATASFGALSLSSSGSYDTFVAKYNTLGSAQWALKAGSTGSDGGRGIALDALNNVYLAGSFSGTVTFGGTSLQSAGSTDAFIAKISSAGAWQWAVRGGGASAENPTDVAVDAFSNVFVSGTFTSPTVTFGASTLTSAGGQDAFVLKLDAAGAWQWAVSNGGNSTDAFTGIGVDGNGNVVVSGYYLSTSLKFGALTLANAGANDMFVAGLTSAAGAWQWAGKCLYGSGYDNLNGLSVDPAGRLYLAGSFNSNPYMLGNGNGLSADLAGQAPGAGYSIFTAIGNISPTLTSFTPVSGAVGTPVTITGTNLGNTTTVWFNGIATNSITINSATSITVNVPNGANLNPTSQPIKLLSSVNGYGISPASFTVTGEVTLLADSVSAPPGTSISIPVRVKGFQSMAALQGALLFDATKLTYTGISQTGVPGLTSANFANPASGKITFAWNAASNAATTVADNSVVFALNFTVGALTPGTTVPIAFANNPVALMVVKSNLTQASFITKNGKAQAPAGSATLGGTVMNAVGTPIPGVTMTCTPLAAAQAVTTTANGQFSFANLVATGSYALLPGKANDVTVNNGLSVLDLALMQRHILGTTLLNNAYKVVAADVDRSGSVTMTDVALARNVLLGAATSFPKGRLWTFVRSNQVFANANSPWPIDTFRAYTSLATAAGQNFIGCKLGDVDNSWDSSIPRPATAGVPVNFTVDSAQVSVGQHFSVPIRVDDFRQISALQLTASWDPAALRLVGVANGDLPGVITNQARAAGGQLPLLWTDATGGSQSQPNGAALLWLSFEAIGNGLASIDLSADLLPIHVYDAALVARLVTHRAGTVSIGMAVTGASAYNDAAVFTLYPNPAHEAVRITGVTGKTVQLFDALGREVRAASPRASEVEFDLQGLPPGLYTVRCGAAARRLVIK